MNTNELQRIPCSGDESASLEFRTPRLYANRQEKAAYVREKYGPILRGRLLDVGAGQCHLRTLLPEDAEYIGIDLTEEADQRVDLQDGRLPFEDKRFECVLCLDVLEHVEPIHQLFDELCRVSAARVVVSLPNPWRSFLGALREGSGRTGEAMKFYGLPEEPPLDRHRWFFSPLDAKDFLEAGARRNGFRIRQLDLERIEPPAHWLKRLAAAWGLGIGRDDLTLRAGSLWAVLERPAEGD